MISSIGSAPQYSTITPEIQPRTEQASTQPARPSVPEVTISDEGKKLAAAGAVVSNPVAVAVVSTDPQVDQVANNIYMGQQNQRMYDSYTAQTDSSETDNSTQLAPVAIATVSRNDQADQLANNIYMGRQAQLMLDTYSQSYQTAPRTTVEESA